MLFSWLLFCYCQNLIYFGAFALTVPSAWNSPSQNLHGSLCHFLHMTSGDTCPSHTGTTHWHPGTFTQFTLLHCSFYTYYHQIFLSLFRNKQIKQFSTENKRAKNLEADHQGWNAKSPTYQLCAPEQVIFNLSVLQFPPQWHRDNKGYYFLQGFWGMNELKLSDGHVHHSTSVTWFLYVWVMPLPRPENRALWGEWASTVLFLVPRAVPGTSIQ